jgi:sugar/nucleoside kinase (ribokinase family)
MGNGMVDSKRRLIAQLKADCPRRHVLLGFDGFIDDLCHVMDVRVGGRPAERIGTITEFARMIGDAAGLSCALELESQGVRTGGNATNMGRAVLSFGNDLSLIATLGEDEIHPLFRVLAESCKAAVSIGEPGCTTALEFLDGKIMLTRTQRFSAIGWDSICARVSADRLRRIVDSASLIGLLDWTIFPRMDEITNRFLDLISNRDERPAVFIDLSDLRRVTKHDIIGMADMAARCGRATQTILSLNESESSIAAEALSINEDGAVPRAGALCNRLGIAVVIIHPLTGAALATCDGASWVDGPYTPRPLISTGAGDNFNAGFCNGWLLNMPPTDCAALGAYTSGYYVRNGISPGKRELIDLIETSNS